MERVAWSDERLDDLSRRMDAGFERVDRDVRELRSEMHSGFANLRSELGSEIKELRGAMSRFGTAIIATLVVSMVLHGN
jgi:hypothetical protein